MVRNEKLKKTSSKGIKTKPLRRSGLTAGAVSMVPTTLQGADIVIGVRSEPSSIDPYVHNLGPNSAMLGQIFDRLS